MTVYTHLGWQTHKHTLLPTLNGWVTNQQSSECLKSLPFPTGRDWTYFTSLLQVTMTVNGGQLMARCKANSCLRGSSPQSCRLADIFSSWLWITCSSSTRHKNNHSERSGPRVVRILWNKTSRLCSGISSTVSANTRSTAHTASSVSVLCSAAPSLA